jgi:5'(3')-deoxyribonucleotidase
MPYAPKFNEYTQKSTGKTFAFEVFLDMDGVISDFDQHAIDTGMVRADGKKDYNKMNSHEWYASMPAYKGARSFYDALCKVARVRILTAPLKHIECFSGKADWLKRFVPERKQWILSDLMIVASKDKKLVAGPRRILIDDREGNVQDWIDAGGMAIHHKGDFEQTLNKLKFLLENYRPVYNGINPKIHGKWRP